MFGEVLDMDDIAKELEDLLAADIMANEEQIPDAPLGEIQAPKKDVAMEDVEAEEEEEQPERQER